MQRNLLKARHPNLPSIPLLGLKRQKLDSESNSQAKDIVLTPLETAGGVASNPLPHPHPNVGYGTNNEGKGVTHAPSDSVPDTTHTAPKTPLKATRQTSKPGQSGLYHGWSSTLRA